MRVTVPRVLRQSRIQNQNHQKRALHHPNQPQSQEEQKEPSDRNKNVCERLKDSHDEYYKKISAQKAQAVDIERKIKTLNEEMSALKRKWSNNVSQRTYNDFMDDYGGRILPNQAKLPSKIIRDIFYDNLPDVENNAEVYNYIKSLENKIKDYERKLSEVQKNIEQTNLILDRIRAEINAEGC